MISHYEIAVYERNSFTCRPVEGTARRTAALDIIPMFIMDLEARVEEGQFVGTKDPEIARKYNLQMVK